VAEKNNKIYKLILSALFLAIGTVLPLFTAQVKEIGDSLLPMHLAVMLCAFLCGPFYSGAVGFILPFFRSLIFGMPPLYPNAVYMSLELLCYALVIGFLYKKLENRGIAGVYASLVTAQISGRIVWGISKVILLGIGKNGFTFMAFITGGFVDALPGIALQLVLIPFIVVLYKKINKNRV